MKVTDKNHKDQLRLTAAADEREKKKPQSSKYVQLNDNTVTSGLSMSPGQAGEAGEIRLHLYSPCIIISLNFSSIWNKTLYCLRRKSASGGWS